MVWGWYGTTKEKAQVSVHFELLTKPDGLPELGAELQGKIRTFSLAELESFEVQVNLSEEITYLSFMTIGISRYATHDWDGTIDFLTAALKSVQPFPESLKPAAIYFFRANAYTFEGDKDQAITDYTQAIEFDPNNLFFTIIEVLFIA